MVTVGLVLLLTNLDNSSAAPVEQIDTALPNAEGEKISSIINDALSAIHAAEASGANVSPLVDQFNIAIELLRLAEGPDFGSCSSFDQCTDNANQIFVSIINDADGLSENAKMEYYENMAVGEIYAILIAFALSFVGLYLYGQYKSHELKRFLEMEVKEN
ncbi:MAG: hypothetical protein HMLIMOIP_001327 [Candidatus Nitrosomirales archaeon]|jgi:hypothetical protein